MGTSLMRQAIRRRLRDDRGVSVIVVFLVFFPLFLLALVMLIEVSRLQAMKTANDVITHVAANAAVRQADYEALADGTSVKIRLKDGTGGSSGDPLSSVDLGNPSRLRQLYVLPGGGRGGGGGGGGGYGGLQFVDAADTDRVDLVNAGNLARIVYHANANANGLNTQYDTEAFSGGTSTIPANSSATVYNLDSADSWSYDNTVLGTTGVMAHYPGVEVRTRVLYTPTAMLFYLTAGNVSVMSVESQAVSQIVPGRSAGR